MDGLGLAETTPGPLIMVVQFVGFMGGWQHPRDCPAGRRNHWRIPYHLGDIYPVLSLDSSSADPISNCLRGNIRLSTALSAITAAVVGVVLNFAVWFAMNALFPTGHGLDWVALTISVVAFVGMWKWKWDVIPVVVGSGLAGLAYKMLLVGLLWKAG